MVVETMHHSWWNIASRLRVKSAVTKIWMEIIKMIMKIGKRMKRRRKNLYVYKIQGADTISMLRLLLYWWHCDLSPLIHSHTYHLTGSPFTEHNGTWPPQGGHSTYQSLNIQRSHSLLATSHTVCNATQSSYTTLQNKMKLETKHQQSPCLY